MKTKPSHLSRINLSFKTGKIRRKGETGKVEEGSKRYEARVWNAEEKGC